MYVEERRLGFTQRFLFSYNRWRPSYVRFGYTKQVNSHSVIQTFQISCCTAYWKFSKYLLNLVKTQRNTLQISKCSLILHPKPLVRTIGQVEFLCAVLPHFLMVEYIQKVQSLASTSFSVRNVHKVYREFIKTYREFIKTYREFIKTYREFIKLTDSSWNLRVHCMQIIHYWFMP